MRRLRYASIVLAGSLLGIASCSSAPSEDGAAGADDTTSDVSASPAASACVTSATSRGETKLCASCECGSCSAESKQCFQSGDAAKDAACSALVTCERNQNCTGDACYCGNGIDQLGCLFKPQGPCVAQIDAAIGGHGLPAVWQARNAGATGPLARAEALVSCGRAQCDVPCASASTACSLDALACQDRICKVDVAREKQRQASSMSSPNPVIDQIAVDGQAVWHAGDAKRPVLKPGQTVTLSGHGFGSGVDIDFSKIMIGNSRVLETDLKMYDQALDLAKQVNYEKPHTHSTWDRDVVSWSDQSIVFRVPVHASHGPLVVQVQKRLPPNESLLRAGEPHMVVDAQTWRVTDPAFPQPCDVVSGVGDSAASAAIDVDVVNPSFPSLADKGRAIFWSYDYNIGVTHSLRNLDWHKVFTGGAVDPVTGQKADPLALFGAYPTVRGEVPDEAIDPYYFDPYPQPNPVPGFLLITPQLTAGWTRDSGYVGFRYAQASNPLKGLGEWIGFNCASCHGAKISYEKSPGNTITRIVPGLPNPAWSMKWSVLDQFTGIKGDEEGPRWAPGKQTVDKTALIYSIPQGTGEHTIVRSSSDGSHTDNDYQFSPIAIPNITHYMPIRRSLSHTESYVGFEGSYIHSEEPDGSMGSMGAESLQALTAYMTTLDQYDDDLRKVGMYRWLKSEGRLESEVGVIGEGAFVASSFDTYPKLAAHVARGRDIFAARCGSCHADKLDAHTSERMIRLDQVGRFFTPTIYQRQTQSIRVTFLRDLYWVQHRGLLTDGHVRTLRDLVDPARCTVGAPLYNSYYTLHAPADPGPAGPDFVEPYPATSRRGDVFRVAVGSASGNLFIERHRYFTKVPWDANYYYWDYQKMRAEYGPAELGTAGPIGMPDAPHPWCASAPDEIDDLLHYLLTL
jgi:mono/diheme cytochrome c family protein